MKVTWAPCDWNLAHRYSNVWHIHCPLHGRFLGLTASLPYAHDIAAQHIAASHPTTVHL